MNTKQHKTRQALFALPINTTIKWADIESLFRALGAEIHAREGSRVVVKLHHEKQIYHRPHPRPETDKGAVNAIRNWLISLGITP
ncbi:HicA [Enterobacterales bacterium CwR94]|nr:HicA [Enterobacterales bacterium CwR94]